MNEAIAHAMEKLGRWAGLDGLDRAVGILREDRALLDSLEVQVAPVDFFRKKRFASIEELGLFRVTLGALCLAVTPDVFIETGVLHGLTSGVILSALRRNARGRLHSIDLPSPYGEPPANQDGFTDTLPPGMGPGWAVAASYRDRWGPDPGLGARPSAASVPGARRDRRLSPRQRAHRLHHDLRIRDGLAAHPPRRDFSSATTST